MKKRLSGLLSFKKKSREGETAGGGGTKKPSLSVEQLDALRQGVEFVEEAVRRQQVELEGEPLPLNLYVSYGDSYVGEEASREQVLELEEAITRGVVEPLLQRRVRNKDYCPHFVALAIRNVLIDHAPLCGYDVYDAVMSNRSTDTEKWGSIFSPVSREHKDTLLLFLNHVASLGATAENKRLTKRGVSLDSLLLAIAPLLLNNDTADKDIQSAQKSKLGSNITTGANSKMMREQVMRIKQLIQSNYRAVLSTAVSSQSVGQGSEISGSDHVPPNIKAEESAPQESTSSGSLQSRSVKVSFPRRSAPDVELETEDSMRTKLSRFGEIKHIGWKEKLAVVVFATENSAQQCAAECVSTNTLCDVGYKVKLMVPVSDTPRHTSAAVNDVKKVSSQNVVAPSNYSAQQNDRSIGRNDVVVGDTDDEDDRSLGSLESINMLHDAWRQEEEGQREKIHHDKKKGNSFQIDEVSAIFPHGQQTGGSDDEEDIHLLNNQTLTMQDMTTLSNLGNSHHQDDNKQRDKSKLSNIEEEGSSKHISEVSHLGNVMNKTDFSDIEDIPLLDDMSTSHHEVSELTKKQGDDEKHHRMVKNHDILLRSSHITSDQNSLIDDIPMLEDGSDTDSTGRLKSVDDHSKRNGKDSHLLIPENHATDTSTVIEELLAKDDSARSSPNSSVSMSPVPSKNEERKNYDIGDNNWRMASRTPQAETTWKSATLAKSKSNEFSPKTSLQSRSFSPTLGSDDSNNENICSGSSGSQVSDLSNDKVSRTSTPVPSSQGSPIEHTETHTTTTSAKREIKISRSVEVHRSPSGSLTENSFAHSLSLLTADEEKGVERAKSSSTMSLDISEGRSEDNVNSPFSPLSDFSLNDISEKSSPQDKKNLRTSKELLKSLSLDMLNDSDDDSAKNISEDETKNCRDTSNKNIADASDQIQQSSVSDGSIQSDCSNKSEGELKEVSQKNGEEKEPLNVVRSDPIVVKETSKDSLKETIHSRVVVPDSQHYPAVSSLKPVELDDSLGVRQTKSDINKVRALSNQQTEHLLGKLQHKNNSDNASRFATSKTLKSGDIDRKEQSRIENEPVVLSRNNTQSIEGPLLAMTSETDPLLPSQLQSQLMQRLRVLEAESLARLQQQKADEELLQHASAEWAAELTALKVQLEDTQNRLQSERFKHQQVLSKLANKEAEVESLRSAKELLEEERCNAKAVAEREALSTVLAQQRLIALLEVQRDAEAEKAQLLVQERDALVVAHREVVDEKLSLMMKSDNIKDENVVKDEHGSSDVRLLSDDPKENSSANRQPADEPSKQSTDEGSYRKDTHHLREISDQQIEGYLERRRKRTEESIKNRVPLQPQVEPQWVPQKVPHLDYSRRHVTAVAAASNTFTSPSAKSQVSRAPDSSTNFQQDLHKTSTTGNSRQQTREHTETNTESGISIDARITKEELSEADRAMSKLTEPLKSFHMSPSLARQKPHIRTQPQLQSHSTPQSASSTSQTNEKVSDMNITSRANGVTDFTEAFRNQQELSSRLEHNLKAFHNESSKIQSARDSVIATNNIPDLKSLVQLNLTRTTAAEQHAALALKQLSSQVVAPPSARSTSPPLSRTQASSAKHCSPPSIMYSNAVSSGSGGRHYYGTNLDKKQFPFLSKTSFSNDSRGKVS